MVAGYTESRFIDDRTAIEKMIDTTKTKVYVIVGRAFSAALIHTMELKQILEYFNTQGTLNQTFMVALIRGDLPSSCLRICFCKK
ncbi:MAG: hypothetical protein IPP49_02000 [Saprospiraceae bacterium]|nr:hypothetical protein [Saprospiraceae bacterium]